MSTQPRVVRTVLGDVEPAELGAVNYHEHLFQISPLLMGDELDDVAKSGREAELLFASGFSAMIDATPIGLGRRPQDLAAVSRASGLQIVATSGAHRRPHYGDDHWLTNASLAQLTELFRRDVCEGMPISDSADAPEPEAESADSSVRAGLLKAGIGYWEIDAFSRRVIHAIGQVHEDFPVPVMIHLEHGSATHEVLDLLESCGVAPDKVILAHLDRNPDPVLHAELATRGAYLGYDGFARHRDYPDSVLIDCLREAAERGAAERILIGGDVARASRYVAYGGIPGLAYLGERIVPRLRDLDGGLTRLVTETNPQRVLAW